MNVRTLILTAGALTLFSGTGWAQDEDAEATIRLMGAAEAELPDAVMREISLPDRLQVEESDQVAAVERAQQGLDNANDNRDRREQGQSQADQARDKGAEMSEKALTNREDRGRSDDHPEPPENPGNPKGPPGGP